MSAANDGADADSRIAAVARRLIFITVLMVRPVTGTSSAASVPNSTPPVDGFNRQPHPAPISPAMFARQIRPGMGPKNPGNGYRGDGSPVRSPLLQPIAGPLLDQQIDRCHPSGLDRFRQQLSIAMEPPFRRNRNVHVRLGLRGRNRQGHDGQGIRVRRRPFRGVGPVRAFANKARG